MIQEPAPVSQLQLSTTLSHVALALQSLGEMILEVETSILENVGKSAPLETAPVSIQKLDHALQMVDELGLLMQRLSLCQQPDAKCPFDQVISPIRLEGLQNLIAHGGSQEQILPPKGADGHVSLF